MPAGAANGNGDISAVAGGKAGQPLEQVGGNVLEHLFDVRLCRQVLGNRLIEPGLIAQLRLPVGVRQAAHVEHQVGVHRHATLEAERLHQERRTGFRLVQQAQLDGIAQLIQVQVGGVDLEIGEVGNRPEQGGFIVDRFGQRAVGIAQRVTTAGFRKTFEQGFFVGVQIQHIALDMPAADFFQQFGKPRQVTRQVTRIDGYGNQRLCQLGVNQRAFGQFRQQARRAGCRCSSSRCPREHRVRYFYLSRSGH